MHCRSTDKTSRPLKLLMESEMTLQISEYSVLLYMCNPFPAETMETSLAELKFTPSPFAETVSYTVKPICKSPTFGFVIDKDELYNRAIIRDIKKDSSAAKLHSSLKASIGKVRHSYIVSINGNEVFMIHESSFKDEKSNEMPHKA